MWVSQNTELCFPSKRAQHKQMIIIIHQKVSVFANTDVMKFLNSQLNFRTPKYHWIISVCTEFHHSGFIRFNTFKTNYTRKPKSEIVAHKKNINNLFRKHTRTGVSESLKIEIWFPNSADIYNILSQPNANLLCWESIFKIGVYAYRSIQIHIMAIHYAAVIITLNMQKNLVSFPNTQQSLTMVQQESTTDLNLIIINNSQLFKAVLFCWRMNPVEEGIQTALLKRRDLLLI